jgi:hypothetical protein
MKLKMGALLILGATLAGCNPYPLPGPLVYDRCGKDRHLESYPLAQEERHAYGCKSDTEGYLEGSGQADARRN